MNFRKRVFAASTADPVAELARELFGEGMTEEKLVEALKAAEFALLTDVFKLNLQNKLRDLIIKA